MPPAKTRSTRPTRSKKEPRDLAPVAELDHIEIRGAREHNLKSIDVDIPKKKLVVMTEIGRAHV